jgi:purine-nucleoside phosphorylase
MGLEDAAWHDRAHEATAFLRERMQEEGITRPAWAVVLGSGLQEPPYLDPGSPVLEWGFEEIPHQPGSSVPGHRGRLQAGFIEGQAVLVQRGRVHYYECLDFNAVTFYLRIMRALGVERVILTNAAGALNPVFERGDLMLVRDHINLMGSNPLLYFESGEEANFLDLSDAYDEALGDLAISIARGQGARMEEGTLVAVTGPCYETGAELRFFRLVGGDAVSMSTVPEVIFARRLGLLVTAISCITNVWDLLRPHALGHAEVLETASATAPSLEGIIRGLIRESTPASPCQT